jgi:hypothetical protein
MNERIRLPFLTNFFEKVITRGQARFNLYNLFSLMGAFPATLTYKVIFKRAPFTKIEVDELQKTENMNDYVRTLSRLSKSTHQDAANTLSYVLGSMFVSTQALYSAVSFFNQLTIWPIRWIKGYFMGTLQYVMQMMTLPLNWELENRSESFEMRTKIWTYSLLSFIFHKGNPTLLGFLMPSSIK